MRIRPQQKRKPTDLTLQEIGLIGYIKMHLLNDGTFQQFDEITADDVLSTRSTINRVVHSLVNKNALIIAEESYRGPDGWMVPAVLKPNPKMQFWVRTTPNPPVGKATIAVSETSSQPIESKEKPNPFGEPTIGNRPTGQQAVRVMTGEDCRPMTGCTGGEMGKALKCACGQPADRDFTNEVHEAIPIYLPDDGWCNGSRCEFSDHAAKALKVSLDELQERVMSEPNLTRSAGDREC